LLPILVCSLLKVGGDVNVDIVWGAIALGFIAWGTYRWVKDDA
jgi:hypothetical protein